MQFRPWFATVCASLLLLAACGAPATSPDSGDAAGADQPSTQAPVAEIQAMTDTQLMSETQGMIDTLAMTDTMADTNNTTMQDLPVWQTMALTDARTGATFTLADFAGKTVFVETMATWCTNCRQQLGNVKDAAARADTAQVVFLAISVETDLVAETLANYANDNSFDWTFAVATPELLRALAETFGQTIANPPATPHFLIYPDGAHGDLVTGIESSDEILASLATQ